MSKDKSWWEKRGTRDLQISVPVALCALGLASQLAVAAQTDVPVQNPTHWAPAGIASPLFESHAAFDPRTGDFLFVRSSKEFTGWHLLLSRCGDSGWTDPRPPAFAAPGLEADPFFTPDGRWLYFNSTRATGSSHSRDLDIWRMQRDAGGHWGAPERLPEPVNSASAEWFPRPGADGWLYFGSGRPGGLGKTDIWRARSDNRGLWRVENLGPSVNGSGNEYEPLPSPDGKRLIIATEDGYYESLRRGETWLPRQRLGPQINANANEIGAVFSPTGHSLLFARDLKDNGSGEFFVWRLQGNEDWPPTCPHRPARF
jgi:Tol biopolymer transport system component